jgi:hypothetical protein
LSDAHAGELESHQKVPHSSAVCASEINPTRALDGQEQAGDGVSATYGGFGVIFRHVRGVDER